MSTNKILTFHLKKRKRFNDDTPKTYSKSDSKIHSIPLIYIYNSDDKFAKSEI